MSKILLSKTNSLEKHNAIKGKLNIHNIPFSEEIHFDSGIKEMIFNFFVLRRASTGINRSSGKKIYSIFLKENDYKYFRENDLDL